MVGHFQDNENFNPEKILGLVYIFYFVLKFILIEQLKI